MTYAVEWIRDRQAFEELEDAWDALLGEGSHPFERHRWYAAWWDAFGAGTELAVCTVRDADGLRAALPLMSRHGRLEAMANEHSPVFAPVGTDPGAVRAVSAAALAEAGRLRIPAVAARGGALDALRAAAAQAGCRVIAEPANRSPIVETTGAFDDWRALSKPRWGAPLERFRRKMTRDHDARLEIAQRPDDLPGWLQRGFEVEGSGWKAREGTAILSSPETERFYRTLATSFDELGELRLSEIVLDGVPAAFDLCLLHDQRLYLLKTGFDERWRKLAPGLVLRLATVERCFEEGWRAHELLGTDTEWKRKFSTTARDHVTLEVFGPGPRGSAGYAYRQRVRPLLKAARGRARAAAAAARRRPAE